MTLFNTFILPVSALISMILFMLWLHIKLEQNIANEKIKDVLSWLTPLTVFAIPVSVTYYFLP